MLKTNRLRKAMLSGKMGEFKQKAMEFNVRYANILDAKNFAKYPNHAVYRAQHHMIVQAR